MLSEKVAEKAIVYFERAALMQPDEVKWHLMIGKSIMLKKRSSYIS